jgi:glycosyltransferase involved in cell wall biosynthesis
LTAVHQFVPSLAARDAIGVHVLRVQDVLRGLGYQSDLYVDWTDLPARPDIHHYQSFARDRSGDRRTWLMYQSSTGSPMARFLVDCPVPKFVNYHNITPPAFFEPWEPTVTAALEMGIRQLADLAPVTELAIADSEFNRADLVHAGYQDSTVVPILFDAADLGDEPDRSLTARLEDDKAGGGADWLFVGRLCPNKAQHDLIKAFAAYRIAVDPKARLRLVGGSSSHRYETCLRTFAHEIGCGDAVTFAGSVTSQELSAYFQTADVFVCLSRHEGFCVPLLEAMHYGVPIVALRATAVPETLGAAGLLLRSASPALVVAAVERACTDPDLRDALIRAGAERLRHFDLAHSRELLAAAVGAWCGSE